MVVSPAVSDVKPPQHVTPVSTFTVGPGSNSVSRLSEDSEDSSPGLVKPTPPGKFPLQLTALSTSTQFKDLKVRLRSSCCNC